MNPLYKSISYINRVAYKSQYSTETCSKCTAKLVIFKQKIKQIYKKIIIFFPFYTLLTYL